MSILIVGNVVKDTYLNLDSRTEHFEEDKHHTKWLDISFDASEHFYYNHHSSYSGAAITLEVLQKLGIAASISGSEFKIDENGITHVTTKSHRYILVNDDNVSYLVSSNPEYTIFNPTKPLDYLYIDRSAIINEKTAAIIADYLESHPETKLIVYLKNQMNKNLCALSEKATLIFSESTEFSTDFSTSSKHGLPFDKTIFVSEHDLNFKNIVEPISIERIDKLTHLSVYSIAAATILGSFIKGYSIEKSLKLARLNVENSNIDSTLSLEELDSLSYAPEESLELTAAALMKKGILAADESGGSIKKKFEQLNIEDTFENRHIYRNIFFTTKDIEEYLSGIILFDETARDHMDTGEAIPDYLISRRIIPGIKVDQGLAPLEDNSEENYTKGLDGLKERLREYYQMGLRFAKWRAAFNITLDENGNYFTPTDRCINENCRILAEYAKDCQSAGLIPIVEPEVVYDGNYTIEQNASITGKILDHLIKELKSHKVNLKACVIKCNMVLAGKQQEIQSTPEEVGKATAKTLKDHLPPEIAGVVFLSGGQTPKQATDNLAAIVNNGPFPWPLTFSFARALQDPALYAWEGNNDNLEKARQAFLDRLIQNSKVID